MAADVGTSIEKSPSSNISPRMPKRPRPDPTDEEEDAFSEVPSDDGQEPDIFAALTDQKKRRISGEKTSESDEEDLQEIIRQATMKRDVKEGAQVVKKAKGKTKVAKGEVGGGSFQSMGECNPPLPTLSGALRPPLRFTPGPVTFFDTTGVQGTDAYSAAFDSSPPCRSSPGSCRDGSHRLREIPRIHDTPRSASGRKTLCYLWHTCFDLVANQGVGAADIEGWEGAHQEMALWRGRSCRR